MSKLQKGDGLTQLRSTRANAFLIKAKVLVARLVPIFAPFLSPYVFNWSDITIRFIQQMVIEYIVLKHQNNRHFRFSLGCWKQ